MMSSGEDTLCFGLFNNINNTTATTTTLENSLSAADDKSLIKLRLSPTLPTTLLSSSSSSPTSLSAHNNKTSSELFLTLETESQLPDLKPTLLNNITELEKQRDPLETTLTTPPLAIAEDEVRQRQQEEKEIESEQNTLINGYDDPKAREHKTQIQQKNDSKTNTDTNTVTDNHPNEKKEKHNNDNHQEEEDEVIFLFGNSISSSSTTNTECAAAVGVGSSKSKNRGGGGVSIHTNANNTNTTTAAAAANTAQSRCGTPNSSSSNSKQQVVKGDEHYLENSPCGAVNKTTPKILSSSSSSSLSPTTLAVLNTSSYNKILLKNHNKKKNFKKQNNKKLLSLKTNLNTLQENLQVLTNSINNNLNSQKKLQSLQNFNTIDLCGDNPLEDFNVVKSSDLQQILQQFQLQQQITTTATTTSPQQQQSPGGQALLPPSTAAALMSSAAAAAAGAAGGALYGALLNHHHPSSLQNSANSDSFLTPSPTNTNNNISASNNNHSPQSASSPNSLLTGQFGAALGNLFGANGFGSAKMLNELFGRQMKQAQDATSGLPTNLDNAMLAAAMESATSAELLSAANLVNTLGLSTSPNKLLNNNNNNNNTISSQNSSDTTHNPQISQNSQSPKNRRTSNCSDRSLDDNGSRTGDLASSTSPARAPSANSLNGSAAHNAATSPNLQQQQNDLAHHMLRNILQGKKELMQLDQELRSVMNQQHLAKEPQDSLKHNNNNNTAAANNNNVTEKNNSDNNSSSNVINLIEDTMSEIKIKSEPNTHCQSALDEHCGSAVTMNGERRKSSDSEGNASQPDDDQRSEIDQMDQHQEDIEHQNSERLDMPAAVTKKEADDILEDVELMGLNSRSDLESLGSPSHSDMMLLDNSKDDLEDEIDKDVSNTIRKKSDLKRARVENIVSSMRASPSSSQLHLQINGCKKRKLYQPQQHAMDRYVAAAAGLNFGINLQSMMLNSDNDSDENETPQLLQKRNEKNALKSQLRSMQEQLAEMQQKYVQLCSRMEHDSDCQEIEDNASDSMEQDDNNDNNGDLSPSPSLAGDCQLQDKQPQDADRASSTSPNLPLKSGKTAQTTNAAMSLDNAPNMLSQMMSKMMSGKLHNPLISHPQMQQQFNGPLPFMPQLQGAESAMAHPAISNAAAMYLGQQFFFEQEARMAKEAAEEQERQQQQLQQHQQQQQQQQHQHQQQQQAAHEQQEQQRRFEQEQQQRRKEEHHQHQQAAQQQMVQRQQQMAQLQQQQQQQETSSNMPIQQPTRSQLRLQRHSNGALKSELSEKFNMLRTSSSSIMRMSGADLEGLADVLKSEITTSLSALVDTIVTRFVHQRRLFSKQSDSVAAAAEQLNKDLLLASQILDRKSPRTKVADRSSSNISSNSSASNQSVNSAATQAGNNNPSIILVNNTTTTNHNTNNNNNNANQANINTMNQQLGGHLQAPVVSNGPLLSSNNVANAMNINMPQQQQQHPLSNNSCQSMAQNHVNNASSMAALNSQNCQNLIASAPRLNGSQLSFPSPAAAAAAAMGLQMHHAAAAAAMSAAAAASGQHQQNVGGMPDSANLAQNQNTNLNNNQNQNNTNNNSLSSINIPPPHIRSTSTATAMFQAPKTPQGMNPVAAAALYNSMTVGGNQPLNPFCMPEPRDQQQAAQQQAAQQQAQQQAAQQAQQQQQQLEQNEALSLVVTPKKKRHKVTDTRITPRTVSRILAQDGLVPPSPTGNGMTANGLQMHNNAMNGPCNTNGGNNSQLNPAAMNGPGGQQQCNTNNAGNNNANNNLNNCNNNSNSSHNNNNNQQNNQNNQNSINTTPAQSPSPRGQQPAYHPAAPPPPPPMLPVSLPTSVAIPNPSLHESKVFSPYSPFFNPHPPHGPPPPHGPHSGSHAPPTAAQMHHMKLSPTGGLASMLDSRDGSPPLPPHPSTMLHPALLAAAHHGGSPDYSAHLRAAMDAQDRSSDCNSADMQFDGMQPTISFLKQQMIDSLTTSHSSTLTPMHLRKAKLMFFWVRYPSSSVLKMYFPDIKFNKNNTAQLVKWFSNFREFYYIQMEKYARQAVTEGAKTPDDLNIGPDSELYRVLNLHYNRNNHIEVPQNFRFVVEQTLREFFRAIQGGKDTEQSWKKSIYKIISRMDDPVPEFFKSPNFLEQLE